MRDDLMDRPLILNHRLIKQRRSSIPGKFAGKGRACSHLSRHCFLSDGWLGSAATVG